MRQQDRKDSSVPVWHICQLHKHMEIWQEDAKVLS